MATAQPKKCPICDRPSDEKFHPFCCRRCADIDLGRWFGEKYAVPTEDVQIIEDMET